MMVNNNAIRVSGLANVKSRRIIKIVQRIHDERGSYSIEFLRRRKPDEARERIVKLFGNLPRIELFARQKTEGWDVLGNDIDGKDIRETLERMVK